MLSASMSSIVPLLIKTCAAGTPARMTFKVHVALALLHDPFSCPESIQPIGSVCLLPWAQDTTHESEGLVARSVTRGALHPVS